jgi:hypothetical protein
MKCLVVMLIGQLLLSSIGSVFMIHVCLYKKGTIPLTESMGHFLISY